MDLGCSLAVNCFVMAYARYHDTVALQHIANIAQPCGPVSLQIANAAQSCPRWNVLTSHCLEHLYRLSWLYIALCKHVFVVIITTSISVDVVGLCAGYGANEAQIVFTYWR